jgi:hypothetical protein
LGSEKKRYWRLFCWWIELIETPTTVYLSDKVQKAINEFIRTYGKIENLSQMICFAGTSESALK